MIDKNYKTSINQRLGCGFDVTRLSHLCQVGDDVIAPAKSARDARHASQSTLSYTISTPICINVFFLLRTEKMKIIIVVAVSRVPHRSELKFK